MSVSVPCARQVRETKLPHAPEHIALSGMRGKIGLTVLKDSAWAAAHGQAFNTWVGTVEANPELPTEAGIDAIRQRADAATGPGGEITARR